MHLKTLEVRGFKSFADKTLIEFNDGITCVVGPNGSGKSNISDSVKWVLGEQSVKNLRGGKMQDVIFAGTQFRKPVGLAQVSLILDNADSTLEMDYDEVKVTRKLFRSGDSEYYINNTKCRLKDIHELFMDTGIGKEGYSIIGQGKIEAILSGKPEDRRNLLEEAAGIVKFKSRKLEAERKLDNTLQNLQRIDDIFSTYEERLEPLEKESFKAKKFLTLSEELEHKEVNVLIHTIDEIQSKIINSKSNIEKMESEINSFKLEKEKLKLRLSELKDNMEMLEKEKDLDKESYFNKKTEIQNTENEIKLLEEKINNFNLTVKNLQLEIKEQINKKKDLSQSSSELLIKINELNKQKNDTDELVDKLSYKINNLDDEYKFNEDKLNNNKDKIVDLVSQASNYKNQERILENNIINEKEKVEKQDREVGNYKISLEDNENKIKESSIAISEYKNNINDLQNTLKERKKQINIKNSELREFSNSHNRLVNLLNKNDANLKFLIDLEKKYEGYNKSTKILMQHIEEKKIPLNKGNCCILGDIIRVDKSLETAIEIALGNSISNIITETDQDAKLLIDYLRNKKLGRATFLPLNTIKGYTISVNEETSRMEGYLGIASKLIRCEAKYDNAIKYVLGRTVIVDKMDNALKIAKKNNFKFRIVTTTGEVINPGGSLTGGSSYSKSLNIMGRKRKIEELKNEISNNQLSLESIKSKSNEVNISIKELEKICLEINGAINDKNILISKCIEKIELRKSENAKLEYNLNVAKSEINEINLTIEKTEASILSIKNKGYNIEKEIELCKKNIANSEVALQKINSNLSRDKILLGNKRVEQARLNEIVNSKNNDFKRIKDELFECDRLRNIKLKKVEELKNEVFICKDTIQEKSALINAFLKEIESIDEMFLLNDERRLKIKEKINSLTSKYDEVNENLEKVDKNHQKIVISLTKRETELEAKYVKLNDEMSLTYAEALEIKDEEADLKQFEIDIKKCKSKIKELGIVNVAAIEEFKELKEKYTFLKEQKEDLLKAKDEIEGIISDMTKKMKTLFKENFIKLRESFNETFQELFKGGNADLILGDGDELSANIEITVQPPGKKLQNINLMSGGEKGLSAIALLFAIQKMKPSPFCILDEIEAALDDANVVRFAEFLRQFSTNTQFIVITHRKGTMEVGDALYGVTMEEKGVSKIVSVDLNKYNY